MGAAEHVDLISQLAFIQSFPEALRQRIVGAFRDAAESKQIEEGTSLFVLGDTVSNHGYVLVSGSVLVKRPDTPSANVDPPAVLGEVKQFNPRHERIADVTALDTLEALYFNWDKLYELLQERLSEDEYAEFRTALEDYAWQHIIG